LEEEKSDVMNKLFPSTLQLRFIYWAIWIILTIVQIFLFNHYLTNSNFYEPIVYNILQAGCILILWYPVKYFRNMLNLPLLLLFHILLFLTSSVIWVGVGFLISNTFLFPSSYYPEFFLTALPLRILFSLLIYAAFVLAYYLLLYRDELEIYKRDAAEKLTATSPLPTEKLTRIIVKSKSEFHCITVNQIRYIEANGDYVMIYTDTSKYLKDHPMKYWETHLPDDRFVRIHRSFIVNIEVITKIELYEKETYKVHLKNGDILKASNSGYKLLKQKMQL